MDIKINGEVISQPKQLKTFSKDSVLYECYIKNIRKTGKEDIFRVTYINKDLKINDLVFISGDLRTIKLNDRTNLYIHASSIDVVDSIDEVVNIVQGSGIVTKEVGFRTMKSGSNSLIADLILKNSRTRGRHSYIYCSVWNGNAERCKNLSIGDTVNLVGRLHSQKREDSYTAEVSVIKLL